MMSALVSSICSSPMSSFFSYKHEVQVVNCELFLYYNFNLALDDLACEVLGLFNIDED